MDKLFLDANVLFSAAYRADAGIRRLWHLPRVELITSVYAVEEARRNLDQKQRPDLDGLLQSVRVITVTPADRFVEAAPDLPDKDRPILLTAIDSKATHLITGDFSHFGPYYGKTIDGVLISPPADYLNLS